MKRILLLLMVLLAFSGYAQKKKKYLIESKEEIIKTAIEELNQALLKPEGEIYLFAQEHNLKGIYDFDIVIHEKGKVASVFCKDRKGGSIAMQNKFKDFVMEFSFNFKMPKGKKYKFNYIFTFN